VRAGVGHVAAAQGIDKAFEFGAAQRIVGFDGVTANGFGDHVFAEAPGVYVLAGGFQSVDQFDDESARVGNFDEGRQRIEQEGALAKFAEADAETLQGWKLDFEELRLLGGKLDGFGQEQALGSGGALFHALEHFFEEDAFVRGVLVEENHAPVGFHDDVKASDHADDAKRDVEERDGVLVNRR
jgi:hypothetical protein